MIKKLNFFQILASTGRIGIVNEAEARSRLIYPALKASGWEDGLSSISEELSITDGRIVPVGDRSIRKAPKRVDYLLRFTRDFPIAVVEAKAAYKNARDGLQQAKQYAEMLGLSFAYSTNGKEIVEFDRTTGLESVIPAYPTPQDLWKRYSETNPSLSLEGSKHLLEPMNHSVGIGNRYYQRLAVNNTIEAIISGKKRILVTMATGTGKTAVAFQLCWKLWSSRWNNASDLRRPRILYLADRNILVDQPKDGVFSVFGDARVKIDNGSFIPGREIYFALYQSLAEGEAREGLFRKYPKDYFDLIIIDECHRGSAKDTSTWKEILRYFESAVQLGLTATPLRDENTDSYQYFGKPVFEYSLKQGIEDGFLAPYRVHRVITEWDAAGWRPTQGELDRFGREIPDEEYQTKDFERVISLRARTVAVAKHLTEFLKSTDRMDKTIVFCVDQEHANEFRGVLNNLNSDLVREFPDYVCRVTSDEGDIGLGHLSDFQDLDSKSPVILTTSQLLTTGVDAPTIKNVVILRNINSMIEFKQIIGRGTRVRDDYNKLWFNILDYTGSATRLFADPAFDGDPTTCIEVNIDENGDQVGEATVIADTEAIDAPIDNYEAGTIIEPVHEKREKYYFDGGAVSIVANLVFELDSNGNQLRVIKYTDYAGESIRRIVPTPPELRDKWLDADSRQNLIAELEAVGIKFELLAEQIGFPTADPFDLLCHLAFNAPLRSRRDRASRIKSEEKAFFAEFSPKAREVLEKLLEKYTEYGEAEFKLPDSLYVPPLSDFGNPSEIASLFGGPIEISRAVNKLHSLLYLEQGANR